MANVTVRNIDDDIIERLKQQAKANSRSLEAELRVILTRAAMGDAGVDLRALAERIAALTPDVAQTDSADLLREDRNR